MAEDKDEVLKDIKENLPEVTDLSLENKEKFEILLRAIKNMNKSEITLQELNDETGFDFELLTGLITHALITKRLWGFVNDSGTEELEDDILILRDSRLIDEIEYQ